MPGWPWWLRRSHGTEQPQPGYKRKRLYSTLCPSRVPGRALQPLAGGGLAKFQRSASAPAQPARGKPPPRPLQPSGRWASCQRGGFGELPRSPASLVGTARFGVAATWFVVPWCAQHPAHGAARWGSLPSHPQCMRVPHHPPQPHHELAAIPTPPPPPAPRHGGPWGPPTPQPLPSLPARAAASSRAQGPRAAAASPARAGLSSSRAR